MNNSNPGNLSKSDIISFVSLLILSLTVFIGMNFITLGNKIQSIVVALLICIAMIVFIFLAAHAKAQNRDQKKWKKVQYAMVLLYFIALIPCYIYSAKFFDIQFGKQEITQIVDSDIEDINNMFSDYKKKCESRSENYLTELESMYKSKEGREQIIRLFKLDKKAEELKWSDIEQAPESFRSYLLKVGFKEIESEKNNLVNNCKSSFKSWSILNMPQYVTELSEAKEKYAARLEEIYSSKKNEIEKEAPEFDTSYYVNKSDIKDRFSSTPGFSMPGLITIIVLGGLGLVKWLFGISSLVIDLKEGEASTIRNEGGFEC